MTYKEQLIEVRNYYQSGDFDLAHRRLLDCVIETGNTTLFELTLTYCEWLEQNTHAAKNEIISKATDLLIQVEKVGCASVSKNNDLLNVQSLSKRYKKGTFGLKNVDLKLTSGEVIGLVGENGNGKTTLLRLLAAELSPDAGTINYHFADNATDYELRSNLLYIPQRIPRWWGGLMDNLNFTLSQQGIKGKDNLLWAEIMVARLGLRPFKHLSWNRLSSGYRTRFELAKNLLRNPKVLLLDEPLANLDINAQQTVLQDLKFMSRSLSRPFGILLSSQHIYEVEKVSDKVIFLDKGVPKYQQLTLSKTIEDNSIITDHPLIIELESPSKRETIATALESIGLQKMQFNGNVYLLTFNASASMNAVLKTIATSNLEVVYVRNISQSSRRFFNN